MKGIGASATAVAGIGAMSAPASADDGETADGEECDPYESTECTFSGEPDYGVSYVAGRVRDVFGGASDEYEQEQFDSLATGAAQDLILMSEEITAIRDSVFNFLEDSRQSAYLKGRAELLTKLDEGEGYTDALEAAKDEIEDHFAATERNLVNIHNRFFIQIDLIKERKDSIDGYDYEDIDIVWYQPSLEDKTEINEIKEHSDDYELINGDTVTLMGFIREDGHDDLRDLSDTNLHRFVFDAEDVNKTVVDGEEFDGEEFPSEDWDTVELISDVLSEADKAKEDIEDLSVSLETEYGDGEDIPIDEVATPADFYGDGDEEESFAEADLAFLNLELNENSTITIELLDSEATVDGNVYLNESPLGESLESGIVYDPTEDVDGDLDDYEGTEDDPIPIDGLAFVAYNTDDGSDYEQINEPFEVVSVTDSEGEDLDEATYEKAQGQQSTTSDVDELNDELQSLNEEIIRIEEERAAIAGGGGIAGGDGGTLAAAAAAGAAIILLFGGGNS